jgi:hypothetical protein
LTLTRNTRPARSWLAGLAGALGALALMVLLDPLPAHAALKAAAGGGSSGSGGFGALGNFMDHITTYLIWLAVPAAGLGVVAGGGMLLAGSPRASRVLALTGIGFAVVVTAKGLVA